MCGRMGFTEARNTPCWVVCSSWKASKLNQTQSFDLADSHSKVNYKWSEHTTYNATEYTERTSEDSLVFYCLRGVPPVDYLQVLGGQPADTWTFGLVVLLLHVGPQTDGHPHTGRLLGPSVRCRDTLRHILAANKKDGRC